MRNRGLRQGSDQGFAIILVLATLVLLAMLSLTYIKLALIDRNIARNYMDNKRAKLIAQSGVDYAIARIQEDIFDTSWQEAKTIQINGIPTKYTESAGSTYGENRDIFAVTVKDCQSMLNVNDGLGNDRVTANTKRMLNVLEDVVGIAALGDKIINNRPAQGYTSKQELLKYLTQDEFDMIKNLVTTRAWQDENVANPVPLSSAVANYYPEYYRTPASFRYGRSAGSLLFAPEATAGNTENHMLYALDELNPQWIEMVSRSPVNINTASPEVLAALIKDLKGFFVLERRKSHPYYSHSYGMFVSTEPAAGYLYTTQGIDITEAQQIANEIKDCRDQTGNYTTEWYAGGFRTFWQFNKFCDDLVNEFAIITDQRTNVFWEYSIPVGSGSGVAKFLPYPGTLIASTISTEYANQAIADVLKANFNPNLHLNELNPDANVAAMVDKTDLIVNSTEFCFTPMGYFEMESEGLLLRAHGADNIVIANSKIEAVVKLYDCYRETNQKQFLQEGYLLQDALISTNNSKTLEIGPEPAQLQIEETRPQACTCSYKSPDPSCPNCPCVGCDNNPNNGTCSCPPYDVTSTVTVTEARENEWDGYIALPTLKGPDGLPLVTLTAHYREKGFNADYHVGGSPTNLNDQNNPDPAETSKSPYGYGQTSSSGLRHTLCKSYRQGDAQDTAKRYAVSDLRIDGAYVERNSGLAYDISFSDGFVNSVYQFDCKIIKSEGAVSYWIKPSFKPQIAGRPRAFFSMTNPTSPIATEVGNFAVMNKPFSPKGYGSRLFGHWVTPSHTPDADAAKEANSYTYDSGGYKLYYLTSFIFGYSFEGTFSGSDIYYGSTCGGLAASSHSLNHLHHYDGNSDGVGDYCGSNITYLASGHWIHVILAWDLKKDASDPYVFPDYLPKIFINGQDMSYLSYAHGGKETTWYEFVYTVDRVKIGEPPDLSGSLNTKLHTPLAFGPSSYDFNHTSDSTIDEFYIFEENTNFDARTSAQNMYRDGRYYCPRSTPESSYTSANLTSKFKGIPVAAAKSTIPAPLGGIGAEVDLPSDTKKRIIGVSWTWFAGSLKPDGTFEAVAQDPSDGKYKPVLKNYKTYATASNLFPSIEVKLFKGLTPYDLIGDDGFSYVTDLIIEGSDELKYKVTFSPIDSANTTLLYSPIFDDITIFYTTGTQFLGYSYFD